ncbi:MAG TPA: hypothetical protein VM076_13980 [Gemmatimonadaceae bacterium]|nr:hypothetical protein [Gemmatimonadaceae bacterium]
MIPLPAKPLVACSRRLRTVVGLGVLAAASACGGSGGDGGTDPGGGGGGTPGFTLTASTTALAVARGATGTVNVTVARTGTFTGPVSLQPTGQPTGVSAAFSLASVPNGQTTSVLTFTVGATAAAGTTTVTVVGNGAGVANQTLTIQLTVTAPVQAGPFTMSLSVQSYLALPPTTLGNSAVLTITRNAGFTGPITVSATGGPAALVVGVTPTNVTGNTATVLILNGGAPNGTYNVTIRGVATGQGEQSITLPITVAPVSTGSITWQFCDNGARTPIWFFANREASGAWTRVVPNGNAYSFTPSGATPAVAIVTPEDAGTRTTIYQMSVQEMTARAASECALYPQVTTRTVTGTVGAATNADLSYVSMGWWSSAVSGAGSYSLQNLPTGPVDLVAVRGSTDASGSYVAARGIVRRGVNPASGGSNTPLDFAGAESFAMAPVTWTFGNVTTPFSVSQMFKTTGGTYGWLGLHPEIDRAPTTRTLYAIPAAQTIAGDLHAVIATVGTIATPVRATRQIITFARTLATRTLDFGPTLPAPTVTAVTSPAGSAPRVRAQGTLPNEYNSGATLDFSQPTVARFWTIHATRAGLGAGSAYDLQVPDLTATTGWDSRYSAASGTAGSWWVSGGGPALDMFDVRYIFASTHGRWTGAQLGVTAPAEGATYLIGRAGGAITP